jgi:hypothetical protein
VDDQLRKIQYDRAKLEGQLYSQLLTLSNAAFDDIRNAPIADPVKLVNRRFFPEQYLSFADFKKGLRQILNDGLAKAYRAGQEFVGRVTNKRPRLNKPPQNIGPAKNPIQIAHPLLLRVTVAAADSRAKGLNAKDYLAAIQKAFDVSGFTKENPYALVNAATTQTNIGYQAGLKSAAQADNDVTGLAYDATLDPVTTRICRAYDGTKLPVGHEWWLEHTPANHWSCRSSCLILTGDYDETPNPPLQPPPDPGFGSWGPAIGQLSVASRRIVWV